MNILQQTSRLLENEQFEIVLSGVMAVLFFKFYIWLSQLSSK